MLVISAGHMARMQAARNDEIKVAIADDLLERFPADAISNSDLVAQLGPVFDAGQALGIKSGNLLFQHSLLSKILGRDYADVVPFMRGLFASGDIDEQFKVAWLEKWLTALQASVR